MSTGIFDSVQHAFHFDSLVWHGPIALYLFLLGLSAGAAMLAVVLKRWILPRNNETLNNRASENGLIRATAIIAPASILLSLVILIQHLTMPLTFWRLIIYYNFTSVMSIGVMLLQLYSVVLALWMALLFRHELDQLIDRWMPGRIKNIYPRVMQSVAKFENTLEWLLLGIAISLGAYTGFLLAELKTYPLLNNPILPLLFFFSGLSSGVAGVMLLGVTVFKARLDAASTHWLHKLERPVILCEALALAALFSLLFYIGGRSEVAALAAIGGGFWSGVFWLGIVGLGLLTPLMLQTFTPAEARQRVSFVVLLTSCSLSGVLMLRYFILYAGQMTVY